MKKALLFLFLVPTFSFSQKDSLKKIGWQVSVPFEIGISHYMPVKVSSESFSHLLNSDRVNGASGQILSLQLQFFDRFYIECAYNLADHNFDKNNSINELRAQEPTYFIQEETTNLSEGNAGYGNYEINYSRVGIGGNINLPYYFCLKPYASYAFGRGALPHGSYGYKELNSNRIFTKEYSFDHFKSSGYHIGFSLLRYIEGDSKSKVVGFGGLKIEYSDMNLRADGTIVQSENFQPDIVTQGSVNKKFRSISLGIFVGLSSSKDKKNIKISH